MTVKDFILENKNCLSEISCLMAKDLIDDIFIDTNNTNEKELSEKILKKINFLIEIILKTNKKESNNVIFFINLQETSIDIKNQYYLHSFLCKKNEIEKFKGEEFTLWNGTNRLEHYCYDLNTIEEIINSDIYIESNLNCIQVLKELLFNVIKNGIFENEREQNKNKLFEELEKGLEDAINGNFISAEDFFEELEQDIINSFENEQDKINYLKYKKEKELNKDRDDLFRHLTMNINHKKCIMLVEEYMIEKYCN